MFNDAQVAIRQQLKTIEREEFIKASTKAVLTEKAQTMGAELDDAKTKDDIYDAMVAVAALPDPSKRGRSSIGAPVSFVWFWCDERREQIHTGELRRKDAVAALEAEGVAHYTARTQYQEWFAATGRGERSVGSLDNEELPKKLRAEMEAEAVA